MRFANIKSLARKTSQKRFSRTIDLRKKRSSNVLSKIIGRKRASNKSSIDNRVKVRFIEKRVN